MNTDKCGTRRNSNINMGKTRRTKRGSNIYSTAKTAKTGAHQTSMHHQQPTFSDHTLALIPATSALSFDTKGDQNFEPNLRQL